MDSEALLALEIPPVRQDYSEEDTILYALGVGVGSDPLDSEDLAFVYERNLRALPTMASVLGYPGPWLRDLAKGVDYSRVVHGEERMILHRPLPPAAAVVGRQKIVDVVDKGAGRNALLYVEREIELAQTGEPLATLRQIVFCPGQGGFGGHDRDSKPANHMPSQPPDAIVELQTLPQQALIYRLSGDRNPLHADPDTAKRAGYEAPILHGLSTMGMSVHAVVKRFAASDPAAAAEIVARFTAPAFPGDRFQVEMWADSAGVSFRTTAPRRKAVVLDHGRVDFR